MASLLDGMTEEQKLRFLYIDLESRNLADEKTIEKEFKKDLSRLKQEEKQKREKEPRSKVA